MKINTKKILLGVSSLLVCVLLLFLTVTDDIFLRFIYSSLAIGVVLLTTRVTSNICNTLIKLKSAMDDLLNIREGKTHDG